MMKNIQFLSIVVCIFLIAGCKSDSSTGASEDKFEKLENELDKTIAELEAEGVGLDPGAMKEAGQLQVTQSKMDSKQRMLQANKQKKAAMESGEYQRAKQEAQQDMIINGHPCTLISINKLADILGAEKNELIMKDATSKQSQNSRACLYKYNLDGDPSGGIMIQMQKNPVPDEFPGWASSFIQAKKTTGEKSFNGTTEVFLYDDFGGKNFEGAYSYELGKYFLKLDNDYVIMIAFNLNVSKKKQLKWATKISDEIVIKYK